jgi:nucleoside-diphosphate-sugar epimerase
MQLADCKTLINTGTSWQHFENNEKRPVNLYAASKQAFECMARYYSDAHGMKVVNLKLYDTYGNGDTRPKLFATLKRIASSGESLAMSPGEQLIDILHVDDVVHAFCVCLQKLPDLPQWSSYAISSGNPLPLTELVAAFEQAIGKKLNIDFGAREYRPREVMVPWNTGQTLPGWRPLIDLQTGIKRYLDAE